ncbi:MAG: potassium-transporting ATPase subunit KdpC [Thermoanaerobaculia bacterium]
MVHELGKAFLLLLALTVVTGVVYPSVVTGLAVGLFPHQAHGSLITRDGEVVGSELIGQPFADPGYFWSRPSATGAFPYDASASMGSNLGPSNPALHDAVEKRIAALRAADPEAGERVPVDLVTASASGLDPHISPAAADYQLRRVARARGLTEEAVRKLVAAHVEGRTFGVVGEPRVNVLELNLALDQLAGGTPKAARPPAS